MRRALLSGLVLALALLGCDPPARQAPVNPLPTPASPTASETAVGVVGGTLRHAITEPGAITPSAASSHQDLLVVDALFDSLTAGDVRGRAVPSAAVSWEASASADSWTFHLRPGAAFHDGRPVTAADVAASWARTARGPMGHLLRDVVGHADVVAGTADALAGVSAVDDLTLAVELSSPRADLPLLLSHPALGPMPGGTTSGDQPVGNGPFRMDEPWAHEDFIRMDRFDEWAGGARPVDAIGQVVWEILDVDNGYLALQQARVDVASVPPEAVDLAREQFPPNNAPTSGPGLITAPTASTYLLAINRSVAPYTDLEVREAVSLLVDRNEVVARAPGVLDTASSALPAVLSPASADMCELCTFNPTGGAVRLREHDVTALTLAFNAGGGHERVRDVLREALDDQGFGLVSNRRRPTAPTFPEYLDWLEEGRVGMYRVTLAADVASLLEVLHPLLHSEQTPEQGGLNHLRYADPAVDALLEQAARTLDTQARDALLRQVERIVVNRDHVLVPVFTHHIAVAVADGVAGYRLDPFGRPNLHEVRLG